MAVIGKRPLDDPVETSWGDAHGRQAGGHVQSAVQGFQFARHVGVCRKSHGCPQPVQLVTDRGSIEAYDDRHEDGVQRAMMKSGLFQAAKRMAERMDGAETLLESQTAMECSEQ